MAQYELSKTLFKYLDKHLCFPLLEFLQDKGVYAEDDILKAKIALLQNTNMVDFATDIYKELYQTQDVPAAMTERRGEVVQRLRVLQKAVEPIINCLSNNNVIRNFRCAAASACKGRWARVRQQRRHAHVTAATAV
jgi:translation initiation factor 3 subunit E